MTRSTMSMRSILVTLIAAVACILASPLAQARPDVFRQPAQGTVGSDCTLKHALISGRGWAGLRFGNGRKYIAADKPVGLVVPSAANHYTATVRLGGHRLSSRVVLCRGMYQFRGSRVWHSFKVGKTRGYVTIKIKTYFQFMMLGRFKR